jgi:predicted nucleotidyltransferase
MDVTKWVEKRTILKVYRGSHAYGTNHKDSDIDLGGICIPPKDYIVGFHGFDQWENKSYINFYGYNKPLNIFKKKQIDYLNY